MGLRDPEKKPIPALIFGNLETASKRLIFEGQRDAISAIDKLNLFPQIDSGEICLITTRGAEGAGRLRELQAPPRVEICAFPQNAAPGRKWLSSVIDITGGAHVVGTPSPFKDLGEWLKEGEAKAEDIKRAMDNAEFCKPPEQAGPRDKQTTNETPFPDVIWPTNSTNSTGSYKEHKAIFPPDSILEDYMAYSPTFANGGGLEL